MFCLPLLTSCLLSCLGIGLHYSQQHSNPASSFMSFLQVRISIGTKTRAWFPFLGEVACLGLCLYLETQPDLLCALANGIFNLFNLVNMTKKWLGFNIWPFCLVYEILCIVESFLQISWCLNTNWCSINNDWVPFHRVEVQCKEIMED